MSCRLQLFLARSGMTLKATSRRGRVLWEGTAAMESVAQVEDSIAALGRMPGRVRAGTDVAVFVAPPLVQVRILTGLPRLSRKDLAGHVKNQSAKYFRRNGGPLITAANWAKKGIPSTRLAVAAAVSEDLADCIARGVQRAGLSLLRIEPNTESEARGLDLLPPATHAHRRRVLMRQVKVLSSLVTVIWLAALGTYLGRIVSLDRRLSSELATLQAPVAAVTQARREMEAIARSISTVEEAKGNRGRLLATLLRAAEALPDSAYLTSFEMSRSGTGWIGGVAPRAGGVLALLTAAIPGGEFTLDGHPISEDVGGAKWDRFMIRAGTERLLR